MPFGLADLGQLRGVGSSLTIEELTPAGPDFQLRKVVLLGPALPFMGAEWGFENQVITTWYPGNGTEATQQNLGPRELPSTWEGEWKRTLMGTTPSTFRDENGAEHKIIDPFVMRSTLEDIARAGARLRVTWNVAGGIRTGSARSQEGADGPVDVLLLREGRVKSFKTPIDRATDIRWTIEFHWMSRGGTSDKAVSTGDDSNLETAANSLIASAEATSDEVNKRIRSVKSSIRKSSNNITLGQLENLANAPTRAVTAFTRKLQQNVNNFKRVGDVVQKLRAQPFSIANNVVDFARNTVAVANNFTNEMGRKPPEQVALKSKVSSLLRSTNYFAGISNAAALNARRGQELDNKVRRVLLSGANRGAIAVRESATTRAGDLLAVYIAKTGDTPQNVSRRFYGSADHGADILKANRMPLHTPSFRPGLILIIPRLNQ